MRTAWLVLSVFIFSACSNIENREAETDYIQEKVIDYYSDGKIKMEGNTVNGKAHGLWRYYYENGFVWSEGKFRHGKRHGNSLVYFENGKKRLQGQYKEGERVGWWIAWDETGSFQDSINTDQVLSQADSVLLGI